MLPAGQLAVALGAVRLSIVHGPWSRVVALRHLISGSRGSSGPPRPLWGGAARERGGRFTPQGGFDSIYLAGDPVTALAEVQAMAFLAGETFSPRTPPLVLMSVNGIVNQVLDLTDARTLAVLGTNVQELTGSWELDEHPPTQALARVAFDGERIAGIKYPSARHPAKGLNLVVFTDRLLPTSTDYLEVHNPAGQLTQRIGN